MPRDGWAGPGRSQHQGSRHNTECWQAPSAPLAVWLACPFAGMFWPSIAPFCPCKIMSHGPGPGLPGEWGAPARWQRARSARRPSCLSATLPSFGGIHIKAPLGGSKITPAPGSLTETSAVWGQCGQSGRSLERTPGPALELEPSKVTSQASFMCLFNLTSFALGRSPWGGHKLEMLTWKGAASLLPTATFRGHP